MNLQERLLQNEIKHLGQIIQTLSYELIVLQDFLKDKYGSKFENFRKKISRASRSSGSQRSQIHEAVNSSRSDAASNGLRSGHDDSKESTEDDAVVGENSTIDMDDSFDESGNEYDNTMSGSDSETSVTLRDPLEIESNVDRKGGRRRTRIWMFFDKVVHSDNKFSARCHLCQGLVSSRAVRMVEHRLKCKRKLHANRISAIHDIKPANLKKECPKEKRVEKLTHNDKIDKEISDAEEGNDSIVSDDRDHNDSSTSQDKGYKKTGRMLDTIWHYFDIVYQNSMKKAKCTSCGQYISPKAVRLRQHKMSCKGAGVRKSKDNDENN